MNITKLILNAQYETGTVTLDGAKLVVMSIIVDGQTQSLFFDRKSARGLAQALVNAVDAADAPEFVQ